jgi:hypothetical protein
MSSFDTPVTTGRPSSADHRAGGRVVGVDRLLPEEDHVVAARPELRRQRLGDRERIAGELVGLQQHALVGAHRQRLADLLLRRVGAERDDGDLAGRVLLVELERRLDRPQVEVVHVPLQPGLVHARAILRDRELDLHDRDPLDAHGDLHRDAS